MKLFVYPHLICQGGLGAKPSGTFKESDIRLHACIPRLMLRALLTSFSTCFNCLTSTTTNFLGSLTSTSFKHLKNLLVMVVDLALLQTSTLSMSSQLKRNTL